MEKKERGRKREWKMPCAGVLGRVEASATSRETKLPSSAFCGEMGPGAASALGELCATPRTLTRLGPNANQNLFSQTSLLLLFVPQVNQPGELFFSYVYGGHA